MPPLRGSPEISAVRDAALEESAALCDRKREEFEGQPDCLYQRNVCWRLAHDIRALKTLKMKP